MVNAWSPSPSWCRRGRPQRGTPASSCQTGQSRPGQFKSCIRIVMKKTRTKYKASSIEKDFHNEYQKTKQGSNSTGEPKSTICFTGEYRILEKGIKIHYWDGQECFHNCLSHLKTLDLIVGKIGLFIDLLKVNVSVGIRLAWIKTDVFKSRELALFRFYNVKSCCCKKQTLLILGIEIDKVSSCLSSPAMIVGWGEFSEVKVKRDWAGGRGGGVEEESCLTVFHRRHNTHNLTIQSLTVFSPHPHVCHANHIAALVQCLVHTVHTILVQTNAVRF